MRAATSLCAAALFLPYFAAASCAAPPPPDKTHPHDKPPKPTKPVKPDPPKGNVNSERLQAAITEASLRAGAQKLQDFADANGGNRAFGGPGHQATVDFLYDSLVKLDYYDVYKQEFTAPFSAGSAALTVGGLAVNAKVMTYSPSAAVEAGIVAASSLGCTVEDFPADVQGKIALIQRGECAFGLKATNAKTAGAVAAIIYNNVEGDLSGTLGEASDGYAPVAGISLEAGQAILASLEAGEVTAVFDVETIQEDRVTHNVIATTREGDQDNILVVGGHSDSVFDGPGLNDDGSGILGLLRIAEALSKFKVKNAVRFGFWSAEEFGLIGSYEYMKVLNQSETELGKLRAYLNVDMIASPNFMYGIYDGDGSAYNLTGPAGSDVLEADFEKFFAKNKLNSVPTEFSGRSDYAAFIENGIPSGGLFTGAEGKKTVEEAALFGGEAGVSYDINYHLKGDTIENIAWDAFLWNTKAVANSVAKYANSFDSLPPVNIVQRRQSGDRLSYTKRTTVHHKHSHSAPCGQDAEKM
ncbi:aminopeptidase Y precursor vacuolar [Podospora conica]|nr:aminopeptidase Y precursor vacuolar [Schizothecium conicum]